MNASFGQTSSLEQETSRGEAKRGLMTISEALDRGHERFPADLLLQCRRSAGIAGNIEQH